MGNDDPQQDDSPLVRWVPVGNGALEVTHRPRLARVPQLAREGSTVVVTLLSQREDAERIGKAVRSAGMRWVWVPLGTGRPPTEPEQRAAYAQTVRELSAALENGAHLVLHCSAGVHRTGTMAYAVLLLRGYSPEEALARIGQSRPLTQEGMHREHKRFAEELVAEMRGSGAPPESGSREPAEPPLNG